MLGRVMELAIRVQDPSGTVSRDVLIRPAESNTVRDLIDVLVDVLEWPRETFGGDTIAYSVRRLNAPAPLEPSLALSALGIAQADLFVLGPVR